MKTFELTQEQINQLAEVPDTQYLLRKFVPEAFNTEPAKGNWYISQYYLIYYLGNHRCHCIKLSDGKWLENVHHSLTGHLKNYRSATEEEIEVALINEFKKRLDKNKKVKTLDSLHFKGKNIEVDLDKFEYYHKDNELWIAEKNSNRYVKVFDNGKWAEILELSEPTTEEINRVLEYLKNQNK